MCGIVYRKSLTNINISYDILQMYKNQRNRGYEGFGFYVPNKNKLVHNTDEQAILKKLKSTNATEILFHHRFPTSTDNVQNACHPFKVTINNTDYYVVHNGYLYNQDDLRKQHYKKGYEYSSVQPDGRFNDSEALAYDLALYLSGKQRKLYSQGAVAFIVYTKDAIYFGRNTDSPLVYHINDKYITIRSEGRGNTAKPDTLYKLKQGKLTTRKLVIPSYTYTNYTTTYGGSNYLWEVEPDELYKLAVTKPDNTIDWDSVICHADSFTLVRDELALAKERLLIATTYKDKDGISTEQWYIDELEKELDYLAF